MYVSGWPEQYKDKQPTMSSTNVSYTGGDIKKSGDMKYPGRNSPNVDSWFSSSAEQGTGLGGVWQLAWQWQKSDEPNLIGNLKRVFILPESVSHAPSAISSMRSLSNLEGREYV